MSETLTLERILEIKSIAASGAVIRDICDLAARAVRAEGDAQKYETELNKVRELMQVKDPMGEVMHIGLLCVAESVSNVVRTLETERDALQSRVLAPDDRERLVRVLKNIKQGYELSHVWMNDIQWEELNTCLAILTGGVAGEDKSNG